MWKSLFTGGVSAWARAGHAATPTMQRVGTGMEVRVGRQDGNVVHDLGRHQNGLLDYGGNGVRLQQANPDVAVPMLVSPRRYGILWNNAAVTGVEVDLPSGPPVLIRSEAGGGDARYDFRSGAQLAPARA